MLPYHELQLAYAAASLVLTASAWTVAGLPLRERPLARTLAVGLCLAVAGFAGVAVVRAFDHPGTTYQFTFIALLFYAAVFWLPACALLDAWRRRRRGARVSRVAVALALAGLACGPYALLVEPNRLQVVTREVPLAAWPEGAPPLRVVHLSDLQAVGPSERQRRAARIVAELRPDLIVLTGDYAAGPFREPGAAIAAAREFAASLSAPLGVVAVAGHSEPEWVRQRIFEGLPVRVLRNEELLLELPGAPRRALRIFGVPAEGARLEGLRARAEPGLATVLVSHVPDLTRALEGRGVDLHLAGHTHGGQVALPLLGPPMTLSSLPRSMARGLHRAGDHWLHVSAGIGMEGNNAPRIRFLCPPQIDLLLLTGAGGEAHAEPDAAPAELRRS